MAQLKVLELFEQVLGESPMLPRVMPGPKAVQV